MTTSAGNSINDRPDSESVVIGHDRPDARAANVSLADWSSMVQGAFAANTVRAWRADWEIFSEFCRAHRLRSLPALPQSVQDFVLECLTNQKKPATIRRHVSTIGRPHRAANVADPTATEAVKLALKEMGRAVSARQRQARGLVWAEIAEFLAFEARGLRDVRDRALVAVAYDTMCRRDELVSLRIEDLADAGDGSGSVLIRRSKTDTAGVARRVSVEGGSSIRASGRARRDRGCVNRADRDRGVAQGGAVDWVTGGGVEEDIGAFGAGGCSPRSLGAKHRHGFRHAGG